MAGITVHSPHAVLMPVRTPLWAELDPQVAPTPGVIAEWEITFTGATSAGNSITISYGTEVVTMNCMSGVPESELPASQFPDGATAIAAAAAFAIACRRNYRLNRDFIISQVGANVLFRQRSAQTADSATPNTWFNLLSLGSFPGGLVTSTTTTTGAPPVPLVNHSVRFAVQVARFGQEYTRLPELSCSVISGQNPTVNVARQVLDWMRTIAPTPPAFNTTFLDLNGVVATGTQARLLVEATEFHQSPPTPLRVHRAGDVSAPLLAWLAGFEQRDHLTAVNLLSNLVSGEKYWLTYRGRFAGVAVSAGQRHYLTHYAWATLTGGQVVNMMARLYYTDGTSSAWIIRHQSTTYQRGYMHHYAVGYDHLALGPLVPALKRTARYEVALQRSDGTWLTEAKSYNLVDQHHQQLDLIYLNSLGAWDPLRTIGAWAESATAEHAQTTRPAARTDYGVITATRGASVPKGMQPSLSVRSGYFPLAEHRAIADVLNSPAIYLADHERKVWVPVRIVKSKEVQLEGRGEEDENLYAYDLELLRADREEVITRRMPVILEAEPEPPGEGG